jgi:hypothetical protein
MEHHKPWNASGKPAKFSHKSQWKPARVEAVADELQAQKIRAEFLKKGIRFEQPGAPRHHGGKP